jgi:twitching motility protein PilU
MKYDLDKLLKHMVEKDASDIYITTSLPPMFRVEGVIHGFGEAVFASEDTDEIAQGLMNERQKLRFEQENEMNLALFRPLLGRFRVNIFRQRGDVGLVIRQIKLNIRTIDDWGLPQVLKDISQTKRGLVLVVGATGTGKSTTLAAMIDYRNSTEGGHIVSVEDPIEFVHMHKKSIITQREIGFDTLTYENALKNALRQAPDVVLIGEVRDAEIMETAIAFAETGHLTLATLHANNANQAMERLMSFFPVERHLQIYMQVSMNLRSIISQRLIPGIDGRRVSVFEILLDSPRVKDLIMKGEIYLLRETMASSVHEGMQTFDQHIFDLYMEGKIDYQRAIAYADSANDVRLRIKMAEIGKDKEKQRARESGIRLKADFKDKVTG